MYQVITISVVTGWADCSVYGDNYYNHNIFFISGVLKLQVVLRILCTRCQSNYCASFFLLLTFCH